MGQYSQSRGMGFKAMLTGGSGFNLDIDVHNPAMSGSLTTVLANPGDGPSTSIQIREGNKFYFLNNQRLVFSMCSFQLYADPQVLELILDLEVCMPL